MTEVVISLLMFVLLAFGLGYALPGRTSLLALLVPIFFFVLTIFTRGFAIRLVITLLIALGLMLAAILAGRALDELLTRRKEERA
jgi:hypothetical protein